MHNRKHRNARKQKGEIDRRARHHNPPDRSDGRLDPGRAPPDEGGKWGQGGGQGVGEDGGDASCFCDGLGGIMSEDR